MAHWTGDTGPWVRRIESQAGLCQDLASCTYHGVSQPEFSHLKMEIPILLYRIEGEANKSTPKGFKEWEPELSDKAQAPPQISELDLWG